VHDEQHFPAYIKVNVHDESFFQDDKVSVHDESYFPAYNKVNVHHESYLPG
jgi:hypothetical protein